MPLTGTTITKPNTLTVTGIAKVTTPGTMHAFTRYDLSMVQGANKTLVGTGVTPVNNGTLGVINSAFFASGTYELHLELFTASGRIADLKHEVIIQ